MGAYPMSKNTFQRFTDDIQNKCRKVYGKFIPMESLLRFHGKSITIQCHLGTLQTLVTAEILEFIIMFEWSVEMVASFSIT